jgi:hypothetical protein
MFRELVTADLVIADLSIHNATFLLRAKSDRKYPFDLQTDRYLTYDASKPEDSEKTLAHALEATLNSGRTDSQGGKRNPRFRSPADLEPSPEISVIPRAATGSN